MIHELNIQREENLDSVNPDKGRYSCVNCYNTGFNPFDPAVFHCCYVCGGYGNVNWIDNITGNKRRKDINKETHIACSLNNVLEGVVLLRDSLASLDINFVFKMKGNKKVFNDIQQILDILEDHDMLQYHE